LKSILIISTSLQEEKNLAEAAFRFGKTDLSINTTASFGQEMIWWIANRPDVLILNLPDDEVMQNYFFNKMKQSLPREIPLIILSTNIPSELMLLSSEFKKIRSLKAPVKADVLFKNAEEICKDYDPGKQQLHPRYLTDQNITISSDLKSGEIEAKMKNLSLTGAYVEFSEGQMQLNVDDLVKLRVGVSAAKDYFFDAKVVWIKELPAKDNVSLFFAMGLNFIDKEEVFENLFKGLKS
jgi:hypothetical protein